MVILLLFFITIFVVLFLCSKKKYQKVIEEVDKSEYPLKDFMPVGLLIMELTRYRYTSRYDQWLKQKLINLYTTRKDNFQLKIYWANKVTFIFIVVILICLYGAGMGEISKVFILISLSAVGFIFCGLDKDLDKKIEMRARTIRLDIPNFTNKLALLLNAGMTFNKAWEKIVVDNKGSDRPLYKEIEYTYFKIQAGEDYTKAYEDFAKRCRIPETTKLISIVLQNYKRGSSELSLLLRVLGNECWQTRKNIAKKLGEEASSKLLFPMILMFVGIMIIMLVPAVLQLRNI